MESEKSNTERHNETGLDRDPLPVTSGDGNGAILVSKGDGEHKRSRSVDYLLSLARGLCTFVNKQQRWVVWTPLAMCTLVIGTLALFALGGVPFCPPWWWFDPIVVTPLPLAARGNAITAAISYAAGIVALYTYFLNREQKERHQEMVEKREKANLVQREEHELRAARRERDLAELGRLEAEFSELAKAFSSGDSLSQINAAIGMGEIAKKPDPRRVGDDGDVLHDADHRLLTLVGLNGEILPNPERWPDEWRTKKTKRNYPYAARVIPRLAAALHQWESVAARDEASRVLLELGKWAKDEGTDEELVHELVNVLANANRVSWNLLTESLARISSRLTVVQLQDFAKSLAPLFLSAIDQKRRDFLVGQFVDHLLSDILQVKGGKTVRPIVEVTEPELSSARLRARTFSEVSSSLRAAFATLSDPPDVPLTLRVTDRSRTELLGRSHKTAFESTGEWHRAALVARKRRGLNLWHVRLYADNLSGCFLSFSDFQKAILIGVGLRFARLIGSKMTNAWVVNSDVRGSNLSVVDADSLSLRGSDFRGGVLTGALCRGADFSNGDFREATLVGAQLSNANLQDSCLDAADLTLSTLERANLAYAKLYGAKLGQPDPLKAPKFLRKEWMQADFCQYEINSVGDFAHAEPVAVDEVLYSYLNSLSNSDAERAK